jgi:hypothetical protein
MILFKVLTDGWMEGAAYVCMYRYGTVRLFRDGDGTVSVHF